MEFAKKKVALCYMSNLSVFKVHLYIATDCWGIYVRLYMAADKQTFITFFRNSVPEGVGNHHVFPFIECNS